MVGGRLRAARLRAKMRQVDLAVALGDRYDHSMISKVERNLSALLADGLAKAARVLGVSTDYLLGLTDDPRPVEQLVADVTTESRSAIIQFPGKGEAVAVRELQAAAGSGALELDEKVTGYLYFRASWLRAHGIRPDGCSVIGITGESMEPTLPAGCSVLLDHDSSQLRDGAVFVVCTVDGLVVKRVQRSHAGWQLASDNAAWAPVPFDRDCRVVGQVRWMGMALG